MKEQLKISTTLSAIHCTNYDCTCLIVIPEEIANGLNWDEEESDTLTWAILNDNTVILERNKLCDSQNKDLVVGGEISIKLEICEFQEIYMIEVPKEIEPDLKWEIDDPIDWIILERNKVILQRFEAPVNKELSSIEIN